MTPEIIKEKAIELSKQLGLLAIDRSLLCNEVGIACGSFNYIYGASFGELVEELRREGYPLGSAEVAPQRTSRNLRIAQIVERVAAYVAETGDLQIARKDAAELAGVSEPLIARYFGGVQGLRDAVVAHGLATRDARIVGAAIAARHEAVNNCDPALRKAALATL